MAGAQKKKSKPVKLPKTIAQCADRLYTVKEERLEAQRELEPFKEEERALSDHIINNLPKSQASGISGKVARVSVVTKTVPSVEDWEKLYAHILKTKDFSLLGRSINAAAIEERWAAKKAVPGVGTFKVVQLSLNKL